MPQSLSALHLHFVFSTKHRAGWIAPTYRDRVYDYIGGILRGSGYVLLAAGGMPDHVHLLVSAGRECSAAEIMRVVKTNSSRWMHDTFPDLGGFAWQAGYGVFAVSHSNLPAVRAYLAGQEAHHARQSFQDEFREFLRRHEIEWDERYVWD